MGLFVVRLFDFCLMGYLPDFMVFSKFFVSSVQICVLAGYFWCKTCCPGKISCSLLGILVFFCQKNFVGTLFDFICFLCMKLELVCVVFCRIVCNFTVTMLVNKRVFFAITRLQIRSILDSRNSGHIPYFRE